MKLDLDKLKKLADVAAKGSASAKNMTEEKAQRLIFDHFRLAFVEKVNGHYRLTIDGEDVFTDPVGDKPVEFIYPDIFHPTSMIVGSVVITLASSVSVAIKTFIKMPSVMASILVDFGSWQAALMTIASGIEHGLVDKLPDSPQ